MAVVINAAGGRAARERPGELAGLFQKLGLQPRMFVAKSASELEGNAEEAAEASDLVVAAGGDGTANCVAAEVLKRGKSMAVLPLGTLNHFSRDIGMPPRIEDAVMELARAEPVRVDVGMVNDRLFLNNSGLGLYPQLVEQREQEERLGRNKRSAFLWAALAVFDRFPFVNVRLEVEGQELRRTTPLLFVGNNRYDLEGFRIGRRERLDGGQLCLYVAHTAGRRGLVRLAFAALFGRLHRTSDFDAFVASEFTIESIQPTLEVSCDGEVSKLNAPLVYSIRPRALTVLAPRSRTAA